MQIATKKLKTGFELPVFGIGTWGVGGRGTRDPHNDDKADIRAIKTAIELGITHTDTAELNWKMENSDIDLLTRHLPKIAESV